MPKRLPAPRSASGRPKYCMPTEMPAPAWPTNELIAVVTPVHFPSDSWTRSSRASCTHRDLAAGPSCWKQRTLRRPRSGPFAASAAAAGERAARNAARRAAAVVVTARAGRRAASAAGRRSAPIAGRRIARVAQAALLQRRPQSRRRRRAPPSPHENRLPEKSFDPLRSEREFTRPPMARKANPSLGKAITPWLYLSFSTAP